MLKNAVCILQLFKAFLLFCKQLENVRQLIGIIVHNIKRAMHNNIYRLEHVFYSRELVISRQDQAIHKPMLSCANIIARS